MIPVLFWDRLWSACVGDTGALGGRRVGDGSIPAGRTTLSNLTPGLQEGWYGGDMQVGGVQCPEHRPHSHPAATPPCSIQKGSAAPLALVLLSSMPPPLPIPPPPNLNQIRENKTICSGDFLNQSWTCSGPLKIKCLRACDGELWAVDKSKWWGFGVSGPEGWHVASSITRIMTTVLTLASPWKPSADRHNSNYQFAILSWGQEPEEAGRCRDPALKCAVGSQVCSHTFEYHDAQTSQKW